MAAKTANVIDRKASNIKEQAEEIMDRWEDVLDEDDEPDEYFSD